LEKQDNDLLFSIEEVADILGIPQTSYRIRKLSEKLKEVRLFNSITIDGIRHYPREKILNFIEGYISKEHLCKELNLKIGRVEDLIKEYNIPVIELGYNISLKFISRENISFLSNKRNTKENIKERYDAEIKSKGLVTLRVLRESLNIHPKNKRQINSILNEFNIEIIDFKNISCISISDQAFLVQKQNELLEEYNNNYCDLNQAKKYLTQGSIGHYNFVGKLNWTPIPALLRPYYSDVRSLYKIDALEKLKKRNQRRIFLKDSNIITSSNVYSVYCDSIEYMDLEISEKIEKTVELWHEYVRVTFSNTRTRNLKALVSKYTKAYETLVSRINKEIFYYSAADLNNKVFNKETVTHKRFLHQFCKVVYESFTRKGIKVFDFYNLSDPSKTKGKLVQQDLSRYTLKEYQRLFNYCVQLDYHKKKSINDIKNLLANQRYSKYDSGWLYVMTHLTNNWRHSTILDNLPRLNIERTRVTDLDWFLNNDLSIEEANDIIYQIGRYQIHINKNESEGLFNVSDPLKLSFATAACICELRNQLSTPENSKLLWLGDNDNRLETNNNPHKSFFENFDKEFKFSNRKMNRTLATLIWSIFKNTGEGLETAKASRGHYHENSTKVYIKLTDKELGELIDDVFDRGKFGYAYKILADLVYGKSDDRSIETKRIQAVEERFGGISKLEATAGLMNRIVSEEQEMKDLLTSLTHEQVQYLYSKCLSNTLFSKEKHYQCIMPKCRYPEREYCHDCPFSIGNVYAISNLLDEYIYQIGYIIDNFENESIGEKKRMSNQFYLLYNKVCQARDQFGDGVVYSFIEGGKERLQELALQMPRTKSYITIKN
jgi:hypothetical protein